MITRKLRQLLIVAPILLLQACGGGSGGSPDNGASVLNSQLAIASNYTGGVVGMGTLAFAMVSELEQGGTDLNGDGDFADNVMFMIDSVTGMRTNLGIAATVGVATNDTHIAWGVSEASQGGVDMNGDGDMGDRVVVVFDPSLPVSPANPFNTGMSIDENSPLIGSGNLFVFATNEINQGIDLNGDTNLDDFVVHSFDTSSMTLFNTGLATVDFSFRTQFDLFIFTADEPSQETGMGGAAADLNSDGDGADTILYLVNPSMAMITGLPRSIVPASYGIYGSAAMPVLVFSIDEANSGAVSFNSTGLTSDFDAQDFICAVFDVNTMTETIPGGGIAVEPLRYSGSATRLVFSVSETENADNGTDFNADGDTSDFVPFWLDLANPAMIHNVGIAQDDGTTGFPLVCGESILILADEATQGPNGTNYNGALGDVDFQDTVFFHVNTVGGVTVPTNLNFAGNEGLCSDVAFDFLTVIANEAANGSSDLNNDGDTGDEIAYFFSITAGVVSTTPTQVGSSGNTVLQDCGTSVRYLSFAPENSSIAFGDANNDGDFDDHVLLTAQINKADGSLIGTRILGSVETNVATSTFPILLSDSIVAFPTGEGTVGPGVNYNANMGDTDIADSILFLGRLDCP